jgi:hypothetical protein
MGWFGLVWWAAAGLVAGLLRQASLFSLLFFFPFLFCFIISTFDFVYLNSNLNFVIFAG